ncbi:MAG TPA: LamG domain-containing protein, partial [Fibrella sp.]
MAQAQCVPKPSGIVAWWKAENNAIDSVGGNNGTLNHGATFAAGKVGQAFSFDGVDDKITVRDAENLKLTSSLTLEAWVLVTALPRNADAGWGKILLRGDDRDGIDPYFLAVNANGNVYFHIEKGIQGQNLAAPAPIGRFVHIAGTLDGSTGLMRLYLDGVLASETVTTLRPEKDLDPTRNPGLGIGNSQNASKFKFPFNGLIDEVSIYNRALTATEIQELYNAGSGGKCDVLPRLVVSDPAPVNEGTASVPGSATFNVNLSFPITQPVTV